MKLYRKIKHNEKVCRAQELDPTPKVKAAIGSKVKTCLKTYLSHNLKATEANLMKLHRKIKHNQQDLGFTLKGENMFLQLLEKRLSEYHQTSQKCKA